MALYHWGRALNSPDVRGLVQAWQLHIMETGSCDQHCIIIIKMWACKKRQQYLVCSENVKILAGGGGGGGGNWADNLT